MSRRGRLNRSVRWAALLALLLATLAPSVAHALRHLRGETMPWSQLCSATGGKRVVFGWEDKERGSGVRTHAFESCGLCALHSGGWAPTPAAASVALRIDLRGSAPTGRPSPAWRQLPWSAALPRAPPQRA
jgi:hypothetical protein